MKLPESLVSSPFVTNETPFTSLLEKGLTHFSKVKKFNKRQKELFSLLVLGQTIVEIALISDKTNSSVFQRIRYLVKIKFPDATSKERAVFRFWQWYHNTYL